MWSKAIGMTTEKSQMWDSTIVRTRDQRQGRDEASITAGILSADYNLTPCQGKGVQAPPLNLVALYNLLGLSFRSLN